MPSSIVTATNSLPLFGCWSNSIFNTYRRDRLSRDASRPFVEIAKELEISDATVHMRVRRLMAAGIIRKFTIATDSRLLGYDHLAFIGINIKEGSVDEVTASLSKLDEILEIHEM